MLKLQKKQGHAEIEGVSDKFKTKPRKSAIFRRFGR
jgi:hypothetical protein